MLNNAAGHWLRILNTSSVSKYKQKLVNKSEISQSKHGLVIWNYEAKREEKTNLLINI
jgi:NAD(P)-dependent dehydrogenase (short-subunit alcohol dehydrogenase family)